MQWFVVCVFSKSLSIDQWSPTTTDHWVSSHHQQQCEEMYELLSCSLCTVLNYCTELNYCPAQSSTRRALPSTLSLLITAYFVGNSGGIARIRLIDWHAAHTEREEKGGRKGKRDTLKTQRHTNIATVAAVVVEGVPNVFTIPALCVHCSQLFCTAVWDCQSVSQSTTVRYPGKDQVNIETVQMVILPARACGSPQLSSPSTASRRTIKLSLCFANEAFSLL